MIELTEEQKQIYSKATELWGVDFLRGMISEEIGEYLTAENHCFNRGRASVDDVIEEASDIIVTLMQLLLILGEDKAIETMNHKINRLGERVKKADPQWKESQ